MDPEKRSPRSSDAAERKTAEREAAPPRRGTSHRVALALAIGLTLLIGGGRFACSEWMRVESRGDAVPAGASAQSAAVESAALAAPAVVGVGEPPQLAPSRVLDLRTAPAGIAPGAAPPEWLVRVAVVEVVDGEDAAFAGAEVAIVLWTGDRETELARLVTDAAGVVEHDCTGAIAMLPLLARGVATIAATASASLHWTGSRSGGVPRDGGLVTLRVDLLHGASVRGRVVDPAGAPVAEALVRALTIDRAELFEVTATTPDGRFELPIERAERWLLDAAANGIGGVVGAPFSVDPAVDVEVGDLTLRSIGAVGGRVVDARGEPAAEVVVEAFGDETVPDHAGPGRPIIRDEGGLRRSGGCSRADGTFTITGLAAGTYRLATRDEPSTEQGVVQLHELGDTSAVLIVTRRRLRVVVQDETGEPIPGAAVSWRFGNDSRSDSTDSRGVVLFHGGAGQRVAASASAPDCAPAEGEYQFGDVHDDAELRLTLRPLGEERGALALTIVDESGAVLSPATVTLRTPLGSLVEDWYRKALSDTRRIERLAPGHYQVEAVAGVPHVGPLSESGLWFPGTAEVEVRADATTELTLRMRAGGRLRFTLRVPPDATTDGLAQAQLDHLPALSSPPPLRAVYRVHDDGTVEFGRLPLAPDIAYCSAPLLEPGVHRLRFTAAGFLPLEESFTIRAGQFTDVDLLLEPE